MASSPWPPARQRSLPRLLTELGACFLAKNEIKARCQDQECLVLRLFGGQASGGGGGGGELAGWLAESGRVAANLGQPAARLDRRPARMTCAILSLGDPGSFPCERGRTRACLARPRRLQRRRRRLAGNLGAPRQLSKWEKIAAHNSMDAPNAFVYWHTNFRPAAILARRPRLISFRRRALATATSNGLGSGPTTSCARRPTSFRRQVRAFLKEEEKGEEKENLLNNGGRRVNNAASVSARKPTG